jgi:uncharacterized damage-inducible protein DinB
MLTSHIQVLQQAIDVVSNITSDDFKSVIHPHMKGSIGQHLRHVIDHYIALENGFANGLIDYDQRNREANIEKSVNAAKETICSIQFWLASLTATDLGMSVKVRSEMSLSDTSIADYSSTLAREIIFVSSHAVHHFSFIAIIRSLQGYPVPEFFGYAPATITYLTERCG